MARDFDNCLIEFLQHFAHRIEHLKESGTEIRAVGRERYIARHVQRNVVTDASYADACSCQLCT